MLTNEDLQALSNLMDDKLEPINKRLDNIENRLDKIEEDCEITRDVTNKLGEWVDFYFHEEKPYPLDDDEIEKYNEGLKFAK